MMLDDISAAVKERIKIILADDHPLVLEGMRSCLETFEHIEILATATNGNDALTLAENLKPDLVVLDINMPNLNGLDATEIFQERLPHVKLLILSMHDNNEYVSTALNYGARGYVLKDVSTREVVTAIETVHRGERYFSSGIADQFSSGQPDDTGARSLTTREQTILLLLADGKSNKDVARKLDISVSTVETHRKNLKRKLGISSTAGLTRYVIENGLSVLRS